MARQYLLVRPGLDFLVDERVARRVRDGGLSVLAIRGQGGTIEEVLACIADLQIGVFRTEIGTSGDADAAKPFFVGGRAVVAIDGQREHGLPRSVALDLLQRVVEVLIVLGSVVVVDLAQLVDCHFWVGWD